MNSDSNYNKTSRITLFGLLLAVVILLAGSSVAVTFESANRIHITNLHQLDDDLYAWGANITIDGKIDGDLFIGGSDVNTNGLTTGSQTIWAQNYRHKGQSTGAVRFFGYEANIDGYVGRSFLGRGVNIFLGPGATIEKDATIYASEAHLEGTISGDLIFRGTTIHLSGLVEGNVDLEAETIEIIPPTVISGNLNYVSAREINFDTLSGITIIGETSWRKPKVSTEDGEEDPADSIIRTAKFFASFLFGLLMLLLFRKYYEESFNQLRGRFTVTAATGIFGLLLVILAAVLLIVSLILFVVGYANLDGDSAALSIIALMFSTLTIPIFSFICVTGGVLFYSGKIILASYVGYYIVRVFRRSPKTLSKTQLFFGLVVVYVFFALPEYIGLLFYLAAGIIGTGAIILGARNCQPGKKAIDVKIVVEDSDKKPQ